MNDGTGSEWTEIVREFRERLAEIEIGNEDTIPVISCPPNPEGGKAETMELTGCTYGADTSFSRVLMGFCNMKEIRRNCAEHITNDYEIKRKFAERFVIL